jgi:hypothetical protein
MGREIALLPNVQPRATADEITALAHRYWQERGCPAGTPEVDWLRAERELQRRAANLSPSAFVSLAKNVGALLGSLAAFLFAVRANASRRVARRNG